MKKTDVISKCIFVIESCVSIKHLETTKNYINLFYSKYKDEDAYNLLMNYVYRKKQKLNLI